MESELVTTFDRNKQSDWEHSISKEIHYILDGANIVYPYKVMYFRKENQRSFAISTNDFSAVYLIVTADGRL